MFDIEKFRALIHQTSRYERRLTVLKDQGKETSCIEQAVEGAFVNLAKHETRAFVIYGEPQSGKTEMMIALTAKLLDGGKKIIIHLLNDSLQLLEQNLDRFQRSGLAPSPCHYTDILDPAIEIGDKEWVIFCKKNAKDLEKLIEKCGSFCGKVVIDDEADFATPNAKVNRGEKTRINELIETLLGTDGVYIGVTATPARLDLNNTFENDHEKWIDFPAHKKYTGQDTFFPISHGYEFNISWISDGAGDDPKWCRNALFSFLVNVAYLNRHPEINGPEKNYSMLVHTSGMRADHKRDYQQIQKVFGVLGDPGHKDYQHYVRALWEIAQKRYPGEHDELVGYILRHIGCKNIVVMNSNRDALKNYKSATSPSSLFTIVIGGNIVSRGVTFDNLLSMYFTRDVKHKIQQDTYIQRARMFGSRGDYLRYFELTIPESLYLDWHRCFIFHRLSLDSIRSGKGAPVWLADDRIAAVSPSSVDRVNVSIDSSEMSWEIFPYRGVSAEIDAILKKESNFEKLVALHSLVGERSMPVYLLQFIQSFSSNVDEAVVVHPVQSIENWQDGDGLDKINISRRKGFMGGAAFAKNQKVMHHVRVIHNGQGFARVFYKYSGNIQFLRNLRSR